MVDLEKFLQKNFNWLVCVKFSCNSESWAEIEINWNDKIILTESHVLIILNLGIIRIAQFFN